MTARSLSTRNHCRGRESNPHRELPPEGILSCASRATSCGRLQQNVGRIGIPGTAELQRLARSCTRNGSEMGAGLAARDHATSTRNPLSQLSKHLHFPDHPKIGLRVDASTIETEKTVRRGSETHGTSPKRDGSAAPVRDDRSTRLTGPTAAVDEERGQAIVVVLGFCGDEAGCPNSKTAAVPLSEREANDADNVSVGPTGTANSSSSVSDNG